MAASTVEGIKTAISHLTPSERDEVVSWIDVTYEAAFEERIRRDGEAGLLDKVLFEAVEEFESGRARRL